MRLLDAVEAQFGATVDLRADAFLGVAQANNGVGIGALDVGVACLGCLDVLMERCVRRLLPHLIGEALPTRAPLAHPS